MPLLPPGRKPPTFAAPWDTGVKLITMLASGILGYFLISFYHDRGSFSGADAWLPMGVPLALLVLGLVFMVTGYSVDAHGIVIHRLFWRRRLQRAEIVAIAPPHLLSGRTIGLCGIWGFCGTSGFAYSRRLGLHLVAASAYDHRLIVSRRRGLSIVISPGDSEAFIRAFHDTNPVVV